MGCGKIFIVSGPTGVGKTTVCNRLLEEFRGRLRRIVTATTRLPRPGEREGVDYFFLEEPVFLRYIAEGKFLEYANVHRSHYYGTPLAPVLSNIKHGIDSLLIIDVQGVATIRRTFRGLREHMVTIFLAPERLSVLEERLIERASESPKEKFLRLRSAEQEMRCAKNYDYLMVSGTKEEDFTSLASIYEREGSQQTRSRPVYFTWKPRQLAYHF